MSANEFNSRDAFGTPLFNACFIAPLYIAPLLLSEMGGSDRSYVFKKLPLILVRDGVFPGDCCRF